LSDLEYEIDFADWDWANPKYYYNSSGQIVRASYKLKEQKMKIKMEAWKLE